MWNNEVLTSSINSSNRNIIGIFHVMIQPNRTGDFIGDNGILGWEMRFKHP